MESWNKTFIEIAEIYATHSTCAKYHVGAVLVKDRRILSTGYNGVVAGQKHCNELFPDVDFATDMTASEDHHEWSLRNELHAEQNCIACAARNGISTEGTTIFINLQPCLSCAKLIAAAGIKRVVFKEPYLREKESIDFLRNAGIEVCQCS